jgi:acetylornithine deacetylase/succinyl-diaminopimelate desuccinylase-like protein
VTEIADIDAWMDDHKPRLLAGLLDYLRAPSVSTDPAYAAGLAQASQILHDRLTAIGLQNVQFLQEGGHRAVYGEHLGVPGRPTILVYGHYDVQPPDPLELWQTPPFEPQIREGCLYARGASDDKTPVWIAVSAIEAWLAVSGGLPLNVKILLEGEEEVGSRSLPAILSAHADLLRADVLISADGGRWRRDLPSVNVSSRGLAALEVEVRTAARDLHSGRYGGAVGNAVMVLARLLATLHDDQNRIAVAGFADGLDRPSNASIEAIDRLDFDADGFYAAIGARPGALAPGVRLLEALWLRPTIEVNGIAGGYDGPGSKTVTPCVARAKLTCRLGPGQDPAKAGDAVAAHLRAHLPSFADMTIQQERKGVPAYAVPDDDQFLAVVERVVQEAHGVKPVRVGIGGTLPISAMVKQALGIETVMFSYATADENIHAPNEYFRLTSFDEGLAAWSRLMPALARAKE